MADVRKIQQQLEAELTQVYDEGTLERIYRAYLGSRGIISDAIKGLKNIPERERPARGKELNRLKLWAEEIIEKKRLALKDNFSEEDLQKERVDVSLPGRKPPKGHLHPLTQLRERVENIFARMGFEVAEGPEVEDEWHNFDALNIPEDHPARDVWDTFWLRGNPRIAADFTPTEAEISQRQSAFSQRESARRRSQRLLLRTHTSPVQIRYMEKHQPPFRIIAPGRVFRHEATDASHGFQLHQVEGLMVGDDVSIANFKAIITEFYRQLFRKDVSVRLRPSFFPFVEPGFEVDMSCVICDTKGCSVCSHTGWLEMMGAGMVHPNVFKNVGYNSKHWQGFAFGMGLDRLAMMRYKIPDIRLLFSMDTRFLEQF